MTFFSDHLADEAKSSTTGSSNASNWQGEHDDPLVTDTGERQSREPSMSWIMDMELPDEMSDVDYLVLLDIAKSSDPDGSNAWPSKATIAKRVRKSGRTVQRSIASLTGLKLIEVATNAGGDPSWRRTARPNLYAILRTRPRIEVESNDAEPVPPPDVSPPVCPQGRQNNPKRRQIDPNGETPDVSQPLLPDQPFQDQQAKGERIIPTRQPPTTAADQRGDVRGGWVQAPPGTDEAVGEAMFVDEMRRHFDITDNYIRRCVGTVLDGVRRVGADDEELPFALAAITSRLDRKQWLMEHDDAEQLTYPSAINGFIGIVCGIWERDGVWKGANYDDMTEDFIDFLDCPPNDYLPPKIKIAPPAAAEPPPPLIEVVAVVSKPRPAVQVPPPSRASSP
jgi:hypothetical protein